jgi:hypothetical protein
MGSRGQKATVTALRSRFRVARKEEGTRKPEGDDRTPVGVPNGGRIWEVNRASGSDEVSPLRAGNPQGEKSHGGNE